MSGRLDAEVWREMIGLLVDFARAEYGMKSRKAERQVQWLLKHGLLVREDGVIKATAKGFEAAEIQRRRRHVEQVLAR